MSEIVVVATLHAQPGRRAELEAAFEEVIDRTHGEDGCLLYALHRSIADPAELVMIERWTSREALDRHLAQPAVRGFVEHTADMLAAPTVVALYEAAPAGQAAKGRL